MTQRNNPLSGSSDEPFDVVQDALNRRKKKDDTKRKREWEKKNKPYSLRGITEKTRKRLAEVAEEKKVPVGELAEYLLSYGLDQHESGNLPLDTQPVIGKNRLV